MYLAHLAKECQLDDCDTTSCFTERARAVEKGPYTSQDSSFSTRPAIHEQRLRQLVRSPSLRDELPSLGALNWIFFLTVNSNGVPMRRGLPTEDATRQKPADSHSPLRPVGGRLALKRRGRMLMAFGAISTRACCCERYDPRGGELHISRPVRPECLIWPIVRECVRAGDLTVRSHLGPNLIRRLRLVGAPLAWPGAGMLGAHSFLRGAARALVSARGTFAQLPRASHRRGHVVRV